MKNIHFGNIKQITKLFTQASSWKEKKLENKMTTFISIIKVTIYVFNLQDDNDTIRFFLICYFFKIKKYI